MAQKRYSPIHAPSLSMSELVCKTLDCDATDLLIDKWLEHRNDAYWDWFQRVRERKHVANAAKKGQILLWNKGVFVPENIFCRTVDTGRLIPLDRTWTTHVYHHKSMEERRLSMMPVVFTMLPELMLLRGMHDHRCDDIFIIVTDLKRQEMDDVTEYFKLVCKSTFGRTLKPSMEQKLLYEHMHLTHALARHRRTPCFPQIDLTFRAILREHTPPFIILFSHQTTSYSQIFFTHSAFVPAEEIFYDFPSGCPNPSCSEDCEMIRFPRWGQDGATILDLKRGGRNSARKIKLRDMCNWVDCDVHFDDDTEGRLQSIGEGCSDDSVEDGGAAETEPKKNSGLVCSKCRLVKYCSLDCQRRDWIEHRRVCSKPIG